MTALLPAEPQWERGFRCHGYWSGTRRVGMVGLPPRIPGTSVKTEGYGGHVTGPDSKYYDARFGTLKGAKRWVETLVAELYRWPSPARPAPTTAGAPPSPPPQPKGSA